MTDSGISHFVINAMMSSLVDHNDTEGGSILVDTDTITSFTMSGKMIDMYAIQMCTYDSPFDAEDDIWVTLPDLFYTAEEAKAFVLAKQKEKDHVLRRHKKYQIVRKVSVIDPPTLRYIHGDIVLVKEEFDAMLEAMQTASKNASAEAMKEFLHKLGKL